MWRKLQAVLQLLSFYAIQQYTYKYRIECANVICRSNSKLQSNNNLPDITHHYFLMRHLLVCA